MQDGFDAIVLAGGRGSRLGGAGKPDLVVGGRPLIASVVTAAAAAGAQRVVVVGPDRPGWQALRPAAGRTLRLVQEQPPGGGPVPALRRGLPEAGAPLIVLLAADLPFLRAPHLRALLRAAGAQQVPASAAAAPADTAAIGPTRGPAAAAPADTAADAATAGPIAAATAGSATAATADPAASDRAGTTADAGPARSGPPGTDVESAAGPPGTDGASPAGPAGAGGFPAGAVLADDGGRPQWLLSCWRREELARVTAGYRGDSLRGLLGPLAPAVVRLDLPPSSPPPWLDCDTPADLVRAREWAGRAG